MFHPIRVDYSLNILAVKSAAVVKIEDVYETIAKLNELIEKTGMNKALLDLRGVVSVPPMIEMFEITTKIPKNLWVAAVVEASDAVEEEFKFAETVAKNRGISLRLFRTENEALEWLKNI